LVLAIKTVLETGERFDVQHIADVMMGNKNQYITSYEHHKLGIFGKGKNLFKLQDEEDDDDEDEEDEVEYSDEEDEDGNPIPKPKKAKAPKAKKKKAHEPEPIEQCISLIRQINVMGYLEKDIENYGILKVGEKGREYLKDPFPVSFSKDHDYENERIEELEEKEAAASSAGSYDVALFELLKNLRKKMAKDKNLPPYVIFQDPSLEEMATTYPVTKEDMAQINGVGMGKVVKFGKQFIDLIKKYVEDNEIETATEVVVKSTVNKSKIKIHIIQQVDRKVDLDIIAEQKELAMEDLIEEIEHICYSGTKLNLDYYINQVIEPDKQDEIYDYFMTADSDNIALAMEQCDIEDITEEELRLMRIKFLSEVAN
jgi:ATP-dependent DNA helicase RecQ